MNEKALPPCPKWVKDEPIISHLLSTLIDKIDRDVKPQMRISLKTMPQLYDFNDQDTEYLWSLVEQLDIQYHFLSIKKQRASAGQVSYDNAQIRFNASSENIVRQWINRPISTSYSMEWDSAVSRYSSCFSTTADFLKNNQIQHTEKSADEVIHSLSRLNKELDRPATLRALSAKFFWGDSKFLDNREDFLRSLFPEQSCYIKSRPLLINAFVPDVFSSVLFIENQDTFLMLSDLADDNSLPKESMLNEVALVYSAGFRGSASRIREQGNATFSLVGLSTPQAVNKFKQWWLFFSGIEVRDINGFLIHKSTGSS